MEEKFREYHQYTEKEIADLWKKAIFIFDANVLLNMYRYSRETVNSYLSYLEELKKKKQLWIPYQVGYEFFENRMDVICEYELSYDDILGSLDSLKQAINKKYKNHPFLNLEEISKEVGEGLKGVETKIKVAKRKHPNWVESDSVLTRILEIFSGCTGEEYAQDVYENILKDGQVRYENKIPPGFKDSDKTDNKKFGDLILWKQIIDKAKAEKRPIIFVTGDLKEDWWLEKKGKKIIPLPQLRKEMLQEAGVDFHMYTADRFLEFYNETNNKGKEKDEKAIQEVRKIREYQETFEPVRTIRYDSENAYRYFNHVSHSNGLEIIRLSRAINEFSTAIELMNIEPHAYSELVSHKERIDMYINRLERIGPDSLTLDRLDRRIKEYLHMIDAAVDSEALNTDEVESLHANTSRVRFALRRLGSLRELSQSKDLGI